MRGDIFFASDLFGSGKPKNNNDGDDDDDPNGYAAVDRLVVGAPAAEQAMLLRLRDGDAHADDDHHNKQLYVNKDGNNRVSREEEDAAWTRPPAPPPVPPPPLGTTVRYSPSERPRLGRTPDGGAVGTRLVFSPRRGSQNGRAAAGTKGTAVLCNVVFGGGVVVGGVANLKTRFLLFSCCSLQCCSRRIRMLLLLRNHPCSGDYRLLRRLLNAESQSIFGGGGGGLLPIPYTVYDPGRYSTRHRNV